jgi:FkbM family methyltransferase
MGTLPECNKREINRSMTQVQTYECRHGVMAHFAADQCIGMSLREYGEWGEDEIALLARYVTKGATVLDVGANVGTHSVAFARLAGPSGRVLALEGHPETFALLAHNVVRNGLLGCTQAVNGLVGPAVGLVSFDLSNEPDRQNSGAQSFVPVLRNLPEPNPKNAVRIQLPLITIDSLKLESCAVMKIDVEGMEADVLRGSGATLRNCRPIVYFEHASGDTGALSFIFTMLRAQNYRLFWHFANPFNARNYRQNPNNYFGGTMELNVLSVPDGREIPTGLAEIVAPTDQPQRPSLAAALPGAVVPDYLHHPETV